MPNVLNKLRFKYRVLKRVATIAPRKSRSIKKIYISYANPVTNNNGETVIKYHFRNALWYIINDEKTFESTAIIPKGQNEVTITVQGLFAKGIYSLSLKSEHIDILKITHL